MAVEIERKFLVRNQDWRNDVSQSGNIRQSYIRSEGATVRIRICEQRARLTIKGPTRSLSRDEFEYDIPLADGERILETLCLQPPIEKIRHIVFYDGKKWEVDEFKGANLGLVVAEVELASESEVVSKPPWLGEEVSKDVRYRNAALLRKPYSTW